MTITTTVLGPNSASLTIPGGSIHTLANVADAVGSQLATMGWTLFDATSRVYTAVCKDGTTAKYIQVFPAGVAISLRVYQSWNATTHVGTNESAYTISITQNATYTPLGGAALAQINIDLVGGCTVYVLACNRYAALYSKNSSLVTNSNIAGCVEWSTDVVDAAGVPFGAFGGGELLGQNSKAVIQNSSVTGTAANSIYPPQRAGLTGAQAARTVSTSVGKYDLVLFGANPSGSTTTTPGTPLTTSVPTANNATTGLPTSYTIEVVSNKVIYVPSGGQTDTTNNGACFQKDFVMGRIYGMKLLVGTIDSWVDADTVSIAVDADNFQVASGGTNVDHHLTSIPSQTKFKLLFPV